MLIPTKFSGYTRDGIRRVFKKQDAQAPDPEMAAVAKEQLAFNKKQYQDYQDVDRPWMRSVADRAMAINEANASRSNQLTDYQLGNMKRNDDRYWNTAVPFEDALLKDVNRFDSEGYKNAQVAASKADVQSAFDNAQQESARGLNRRGVNPSSGYALANMGNNDIGKATAMATAANKTRMAADQIGLSTKMSMYGGMKGLAGLGATNAGLATGAMGLGNSSGMGMTGAAGSYLNANNANMAGYNAGVNSGVGNLGTYTGLQNSAVQINNASDPMGMVLGAAAGSMSSYATGGMSQMGRKSSWANG